MRGQNPVPDGVACPRPRGMPPLVLCVTIGRADPAGTDDHLAGQEITA
ncbi:hypothetical protein HMPREF1549_01191 [Actinomyces johnsonii F0510]|uniref:Uncharacterized protein n=1 Tax=Actinomyces johnsonii F0510 TaxID=1227262 RepID=U1PXF3_9ACTO|nr:hypothetical protein HMPREF1549_01191 [Actinomyces johnsonii F0510]